MKSKLIKVISTSRIIPPKNRFYDSTRYITTPKIQIEGNWLESLGFHIGDRLQVDYEEGSIHIRLAGVPEPMPSMLCEPKPEYHSEPARQAEST